MVHVPEVAIVFDAAPGWHIVLMEATGPLSEDDPNAGYGLQNYQFYVFPIERWGIPCPQNLLHNPSNPNWVPLSKEATIYGGVFDIVSESLKMLPLDPRHETPTFFTPQHVLGVYPPSEGTASEVLDKAMTRCRAETEARLQRLKSG